MPRKIIILILINLFLVACNGGPSESEINARIAAQVQTEQTAEAELKTAVAGTVFAEQTLNAPTFTPTSTNTPTLTPTPTEEPLGTSNLFIEYILDGSGSMYDTLPDGTTKLDIARKVLIEQLQAFHPETNIGLRAYGHRVAWEEHKEESCNDIELVASVQPGQIERIATWLDEFDPKGMTPLAESLQRAVTDLVFEPSRINSIVMLTDGIETCGGDPCQLVADLQERGINFKLHVIGLDVDGPTREQLLCIAKAAGGVYHDTKSQQDLDKALQGIQQDVTKDEIIVPHGVDTPTPLPTATPTETPVPTATATAISVNIGKIVFTSNRDGHNRIYTMNSDGSQAVPLSYTSPDLGDDHVPSLSPNGEKIAFSHNGRNIYVMNSNGSNLIQLTNLSTYNAYSPTWSPNGMQIAFSNGVDSGSGDIYVMNADGTGVINLTNNATYNISPSWSPDGTKIAFSAMRERAGHFEIYTMNVDGTGQTNISTNSSYDIAPAWSPDSSRIAFVSGRDGNNEIYIMNADGSNISRLTNHSSGDGTPKWSPDGSQIIFTTSRNDNDPVGCKMTCNYEIYIVNIDGTGLTRLTNNPASDSSPSWSPR